MHLKKLKAVDVEGDGHGFIRAISQYFLEGLRKTTTHIRADSRT
jgi:hypothetical protein